ncbi:MAG: type II toxin-antitoxin system RelE/ParE family toxin [Chthoniobacterales bacterium]
MRLIYHPDAEAELIEAARFYEGRVSTLGSQFLDAADRAITVILEAPDRWSVIEEDVRHYLMLRFPYAVYYRVLTDHIRILAFKHHSRHPDYWRYRLSE